MHTEASGLAIRTAIGDRLNDQQRAWEFRELEKFSRYIDAEDVPEDWRISLINGDAMEQIKIIIDSQIVRDLKFRAKKKRAYRFR